MDRVFPPTIKIIHALALINKTAMSHPLNSKHQLLSRGKREKGWEGGEGGGGGGRRGKEEGQENKEYWQEI